MAAMHKVCRLAALSFRSSFSRTGLRLVSTTSKMSAAHDAEFKAASEKIQTLSEAPDNQVKLQLYGLFKQGSSGKCNVPKPGAFDFVGKAKWSAWNALSDISQDDAQKQYINLVNELVAADSPQTDETFTGDSGNYQFLKVSSENGMFKIMFNRPNKKNAITTQMYNEISAALKSAAEDKSKICVLTGAGDYYSSGNDLSNFANIDPSEIAKLAKDGRDILSNFVQSLIDFPKPLIACVNGPAVGIAVTHLGLCDVVLASDKATFQTPMVALGQSPEGCASYTFPMLMGLGRANDMLIFGRKIDATTACDWGLVTQVFPDASYQKDVEARLKEILQLPPQSLSLSKKLMRFASKERLHAVNKEECDVLEQRWQSEECFKAVMDFFSQKSKL